MDTASVTSSLGLWINPNFIYEAKMELKVLNKWKAENNIHIRPPIFFFFTLAILLLWRQMLPVCHTVRQTHPSGPWLPKCPSCSIQQTQISTWGHKMMRKVFTEVTERSSSGLFFFSTHSFVLTCCWLFKRNNYIQQISEASARSLWDRAGLPQKSSAVHSLCNS